MSLVFISYSACLINYHWMQWLKKLFGTAIVLCIAFCSSLKSSVWNQQFLRALWWKTRCEDIWIHVMIFGLPGVRIIFVVSKNNLSGVRSIVLDIIWLLCCVIFNFSLKNNEKYVSAHLTECINTVIYLKLKFRQKTDKNMNKINERN